MVLLVFGLTGLACLFIILSAWRLCKAHYNRGKPVWNDSYFWLSSGFGLVSVGLLEFSVIRVWQALFSTHVPFVQVRMWAMIASVTILLGLCAKMRVLAINRPGTGRRFLIAGAVWCAFCMAWTAARSHYGYG